MKAPKKPAAGLISFDEVSLALDMIQAGRSDGAIAAFISSKRTHGSRRVDPASIAQLREGI